MFLYRSKELQRTYAYPSTDLTKLGLRSDQYTVC